jgi:hypothetical protein
MPVGTFHRATASASINARYTLAREGWPAAVPTHSPTTVGQTALCHHPANPNARLNPFTNRLLGRLVQAHQRPQDEEQTLGKPWAGGPRPFHSRWLVCPRPATQGFAPFDNARHRFGVASESPTGCPVPSGRKENGKEITHSLHSQCIPRRGACGKARVVPHNRPSEARTLRMPEPYRWGVAN